MAIFHDTVSLAEKKNNLMQYMERFDRVGVALSGGCDSSLVLALSCHVLGKENVIAVTAATSLQFASDTDSADQVAAFCGCTHVVIDTTPLENSSITTNPPERCYHCKKKSYTKFLSILSEHQVENLMDGTNHDDLSDERPGRQAITELGVVTPLADMGITKEDARQLAKEMGLANWNRPSASCLATRIPFLTPITVERLELIRGLEEFLMARGFVGCRVRLQSDAVCVEVLHTDLERFMTSVRHDFLARCTRLGLQKVHLDLAGRPQ